MSEIILRDICKSYENGFQAVKNFNLEIEKGELVVFVGPSGCGKSTTLRMIAGLEDISDGELWIGDKLVNYLEPKERDLAMVFQSYALYPQMNIYDNIAFSLQVRKVPKKRLIKGSSCSRTSGTGKSAETKTKESFRWSASASSHRKCYHP